MKLVIVESPTKAKTLSQILPKEYSIKASMGHIRDLPKSGLGVDVEHNFEPEYMVPPKAKKVLNELKKELKNADGVVLATDPDREGEAISWHLRELLKPKKGKMEFGRVVFHELTPSAVEEAFAHPGELDMHLVDAQQARRVLDRLVGYKLSPLLWKKVMYGLSAGRVQSVAVRVVVERERERQAFKPEEYWSINGEFCDSKEKRKFKAELVEKNDKKLSVKSEKEAKKAKNELEKDSYKILAVKKAERKKGPYAPFKTSTLQQSASNVFGFNASRTMKAAQGLFEKGYITYHRTDSLSLSPNFVQSARSFISKEFGANYLPAKAIFYKTKSANAQEAHEAIRVTSVSRRPGKNGVAGDELKIYSLVWKRSLECQMTDAVYDQTTILVSSQGGYLLKAVGSIIKFDGWLIVGNSIKAQEEDGETSKPLPNYKEGELVNLLSVESEQHFTQPPARYSDATLIKKMEELGVGRPSTYAPTISTIQQRGYVQRDGRYFVPKDVAFVVNDLLVEHFSEVVDYNFTAQMEEELDEIAEGKKEWVPVIREFYKPFAKDLKAKEKELNKRDVTNLGDSEEKCPKCGKVLVFKLGKYGKFLSCSGYPDCEYARPLDQNGGTSEDQEDYGKCPNCEDGKLFVRVGRFGKFLACSNYPKCKTTKPYLDKIGFKCPKCGEGEVIVKKAKFRVFYGCSRYPDCDWSSWKNPKIEAEKEHVNSIVV